MNENNQCVGFGRGDYYVSHFSRGIYRHQPDCGFESLPIPTFFSAGAMSGAGDRVWAGNLLGIFSR